MIRVTNRVGPNGRGPMRHAGRGEMVGHSWPIRCVCYCGQEIKSKRLYDISRPIDPFCMVMHEARSDEMERRPVSSFGCGRVAADCASRN